MAAADEAGEAVEPQGPGAGVFCNLCGWQNPAGARFCSQCGAQLQEGVAAAAPAQPRARPAAVKPAAVRPAGAPPPAGRPDAPTAAPEDEPAAPRAMNRRTGLVIGAAALLLVALYLISLVSKQRATPAPAAGAAPAAEAVTGMGAPVAAPLPPEQAQQVQALQGEIDGLQGDARIARQQALVDLLVGFGRPDHAAPVQRAVAEADGSTLAWRRAADLYYFWMEGLPETERTAVAREAVAAYRRVLEKTPDDLDARANMAWSFQYDAQNGMAAIQENNAVLQQDPNHLGANHNRGMFLMKIGRLEPAVEQFEKVKRLAGEGTPLYREAESLVQQIRQAQAQGAVQPAPAGAPADSSGNPLPSPH